jgi:hypothetical protein
LALLLLMLNPAISTSIQTCSGLRELWSTGILRISRVSEQIYVSDQHDTHTYVISLDCVISFKIIVGIYASVSALYSLRGDHRKQRCSESISFRSSKGLKGIWYSFCSCLDVMRKKGKSIEIYKNCSKIWILLSVVIWHVCAWAVSLFDNR